MYFNGFSLKGEEQFFQERVLSNDYTVAGFSYGAIKAFEYAFHTTKRVDRLILLSPAFFQNHKKSFIRTQLRYYHADKEAYTQQFLQNVAYPTSIELEKYLADGTYNELEELLSYRWERAKLLALIKRGIVIEVFIGTEDKIVDASKSFEFFSELVPSYFIKGAGHLLEKREPSIPH